MRKLLVLIPIFLFSSCATLTLKKNYDISISSDVPNAKAEINDSIYNLPAECKIERSKQDLQITLLSDSLEKSYVVKASPNGRFLYGNLLILQIFPIPYLIDLTNQKRFYYGKSIFLNSSDTSEIIKPKILNYYHNYWDRSFPSNKGQLDLTYSMPWVNTFYLQPDHESPKLNTGFMGAAIGFDYYYKDNKYLSLTGSAVMDFFLPFPAVVDYSGEVENMFSVFISLTDNYALKKFDIGYGMNFSRNIWKLAYHNRFNPPPPTREPASQSYNSLGFTFNAYHKVSKVFQVGLIYRPTLVTVYPDFGFKCEHLISLDFKLKFRLKK